MQGEKCEFHLSGTYFPYVDRAHFSSIDAHMGAMNEEKSKWAEEAKKEGNVLVEEDKTVFDKYMEVLHKN